MTFPWIGGKSTRVFRVTGRVVRYAANCAEVGTYTRLQSAINGDDAVELVTKDLLADPRRDCFGFEAVAT